MKSVFWLMMCLAVGTREFPVRAAEGDQLKSDLIGQCMGGREKCWKFQSLDQIKDLVIKTRIEDAEKRVYTIGLRLQATATSGHYAADARVEYVKVGADWKLKQVGLLSLEKVK